MESRMRKFSVALLLFFAVLAIRSEAQTYAYQAVNQNVTTVSAFCGQGSVRCRIIGTGAQFHQLAWNVSGTLSACTVRVDSSADGITWGTGDIIAAQTCTSNGNITSTAFTVNYVRVNVTAITPVSTASLTTTLTGFANAPGTATPGAPLNSVQFNNAGAFGGSGNFTWLANALRNVGVQNTVDAGNVTNIASGQINGITMAVVNNDTSVDPPAGTSQFDVANTSVSVAANSFNTGFSQGLLVNPAANSNAIFTGAIISTLVPNTQTHNIATVQGNLVTTTNAGTGANGFMTGIQSFVNQLGTSAVNLAAIDGESLTGGGGTTSVSQGIYAITDVDTGSTVTNNYGIFIDDGVFHGVATHNYGLWIADQSVGGANNQDGWSIWTNGGRHHFGGNVAITGGLCLTSVTCTPGSFSADNSAVAIAPTTLLTATSTTQYLIVATVYCHQVTATATVSLTISYTDSSSTVQTITTSNATCTTLGANSFVAVNTPIFVLTGTNIVFSTTVANLPHYDMRLKAIQTF